MTTGRASMRQRLETLERAVSPESKALRLVICLPVKNGEQPQAASVNGDAAVIFYDADKPGDFERRLAAIERPVERRGAGAGR